MRTDEVANEATSNSRSASSQAMVSFRTALTMVGTAVGIFFVGVYSANAVAPGTRGGHTRTALTVAGTLVGLPASTRPHLTFIFSKVGSPPCVVAVGSENVRYAVSSGAFNAEVDIERCAPTLFDGADATVTVEVRDSSATGTVLVTAPATAINPVPYARYADHYGTPDCPVGYERNPASPSGRVYCRRALTAGLYDEVVRVGSGPTAFWIDRYETMVCDSRDGACTALINVRSETDLASRGLPRNGQWAGQNPPLFAISVAASNPPARWVTWYQAEEICRASGKRLPTGGEWLTASRGTGGSTGDLGCQISAGEPRDISAGAACVSDWGVQDMVGNLWEWTADWEAAPGDTNPVLYDQPQTPDAGVADPWPQRSLYGDDRTTNITSYAATQYGGNGSVLRGMQSAPIRGGGWSSGARGGKFAMDLNYAPSFWSPDLGFRCMIPR